MVQHQNHHSSSQSSQTIIIVDFTALAGGKQQSAYLFNLLLNIEFISNAHYNDFQLDGDLIIILNSRADAFDRQKDPFHYLVLSVLSVHSE